MAPNYYIQQLELIEAKILKTLTTGWIHSN